MFIIYNVTSSTSIRLLSGSLHDLLIEDPDVWKNVQYTDVQKVFMEWIFY